ncbi:hypothetical protein A3Q56_00180 [Intoshia linei]|uniref:Death domain-containing protein n=1 Tax=Intoshia linei TaxID=1819745 RepID=A0A177BCN2_9BILA|nr:hypothetical protein A3Q56_00180 [Intoshia linei]
MERTVRSHSKARNEILIDSKNREILKLKPGKHGGRYRTPSFHGGLLATFPSNTFSKHDIITFKLVKNPERLKHFEQDLNRHFSENDSLASDIFQINYYHKGKQISKIKKMIEVEIPYFENISDASHYTFTLLSKCNDLDEWNSIENYKVTTKKSYRTVVFNSTVLCLKAEPIKENVSVFIKGCMHTSVINKKLTLRVPKFALKHDNEISITTKFIDERELGKLREEYEYDMKSLKSMSPIYTFDFVNTKLDVKTRAVSFANIKSDESVKSIINCAIKRNLTIQLPLNSKLNNIPEDSNTNDIIGVFSLDSDENRWKMLNTTMNISKSTVSFDTNKVGSYCVVSTHDNSSKYSLTEAMRCVRMYELYGSSGDVLAWLKLEDKDWKLKIEVSLLENIDTIKMLREKEGYSSVKLEMNDVAAVSQQKSTLLPYGRRKSWNRRKSTITDDRKSSVASSNSLFDNVNLERSDFTLLRLEDFMKFKIILSNDSKAKFRQQPSCDRKISLDGGNFIESVSNFDENEINLVFYKHSLNNSIVIDIEPSSECDQTNECLLKLEITGERRNNVEKGLELRRNIKYSLNYTIPSDTVHEYLHEKEVIVITQEIPKRLSSVTIERKSISEASTPDIKSKYKKKRRSIESFMRLTKRTRSPIKLTKESKVLSRQSISIMSAHIIHGLTLGVQLNLDDSTITGIGFDALANGFNLQNITYRILLLWKRRTSQYASQQVDILYNALCKMNLSNVANVIKMFDSNNCELVEGCFDHCLEPDENTIGDKTETKTTQSPTNTDKSNFSSTQNDSMYKSINKSKNTYHTDKL